ncbi:Cysteine desulfurase NFS1 [Ceratobasidium theobromae]|uniref:cysteine desulfurase n=1 Tax=Ceratobasidium theobromae TaxID=1582974 RepID=A0A5N5QX07_9AGAM|nr:Cysteine desulfurase NFS1 [Ceratobasidium theobromae]
MENVSTLSDSSAEMLAAATAAEVWITLKFTWSSKEYTVTIAESDRVLDLKEKLFTLTRVPNERQKILGLVKGKLPDDSVRVADMKFAPTKKFTLVGTPVGEEFKEISEDQLPDVVNDFDLQIDAASAEAKSMAQDKRNIRKILEAAKNLNINIMYPLRPGKKLLVLDLDYTLLDTKPLTSGMLPAEECARPGLHEFLELAYMHYDICIWSQTKWTWLEAKLVELGMVGNERRNYKVDYIPMFKVFSMRDGKPFSHAVKALRIIWEHFPQFGPHNTAHVDDLSRNFVLNPGEGIKISAFQLDGTLESQNDRELEKLGRYLVWLACHSDFKEVDHKNWKKVARALKENSEPSSCGIHDQWEIGVRILSNHVMAGGFKYPICSECASSSSLIEMISSVTRSVVRSVRNSKRSVPTFVSCTKRTFVQPTRTERASVVDTPPPHELENKFTPRADMLGFKLEVPAKVQGTERPIYLDMQATTPLDPRVLDAMLPYYTDQFGNPHSRTHAYGWEAEAAVDEARKHVADLIGADAKDIVFTSGATESNNMIIKGVARFHKEKKNHIITTQTEHKCVLDSCRKLSEEGFEVTYLPVQSNGVIDLKVLEDAIRPTTSLVSIMAVNNETGVIQPLKEIGAIVKKHRVYFHTDGAQAAGKIPLDVNEMGIDLMSISGHKIYGPKGVGAAYVRRRPRVRLEPIISGGGQERGLRSGTLPSTLVVGLGEASRIAKLEMKVSVSAFTSLPTIISNLVMNSATVLRDHAHVSALSKRLIDGITSRIEHITRNGDPNGYPGCVNLSFAYVEGESLLMALKDIALSSGSACTSASLEPSYVLRALGAAEDMAHSSLRFGIGRFTTEAEIDFVTEKIVAVVQRLRDMSPLWEMVQEGIDISTIDWGQTQH